MIIAKPFYHNLLRIPLANYLQGTTPAKQMYEINRLLI